MLDAMDAEANSRYTRVRIVVGRLKDFRLVMLNTAIEVVFEARILWTDERVLLSLDGPFAPEEDTVEGLRRSDLLFEGLDVSWTL